MLLGLIPVLLVGAFAVPAVWRLGAALRSVLENNYISIQCAQHMQAALSNLRIAQLEGDAKQAIPGLRDEFFYWLNIEHQAITEVGEPETAAKINSGATQLFTQFAASESGARYDSEFDQLVISTNDLIRLNEMAVWRNDVRLRHLSRGVASTLVLSLLLAFAAGIGLSWFISKSVARPLTELSAQLSGVGEDLKVSRRLEPQSMTELQLVADSFNYMADRLEYYQQLNVDRLLFEKKRFS
jgi:two-component system, NtrC family, sensor histidine kinase KinB